MDNLIQEIQETNNGTKNKAVIEILKFVLGVRDFLGGGSYPSGNYDNLYKEWQW